MKSTCIVQCDSPEGLAKGYTLDSEITRTCISYPGGIPKERIETFRLGDYFDKISFGHNEIIFKIKKNVNSEWKFLIVRILRSISPDKNLPIYFV